MITKKAQDYIEDSVYPIGVKNVYVLSEGEAERVGEIEREELIKHACKFIEENITKYADITIGNMAAFQLALSNYLDSCE